MIPYSEVWEDDIRVLTVDFRRQDYFSCRPKGLEYDIDIDIT